MPRRTDNGKKREFLDKLKERSQLVKSFMDVYSEKGEQGYWKKAPTLRKN